MRNKYIGVFAVVLLVAFLFVLLQIALLPLETGGAYPAYSTFRTDPKGAKALYESLAALSELRVEQNFQPLPKLKSSKVAVFVLGESMQQTPGWSEDELKLLEGIVKDGGRLIVAFLPEPPEVPSVFKTPEPTEPKKPPPISKRWHMTIERYTGTDDEREAAGSMPRETFAYFNLDAKSGWRTLQANDEDDPTLVEHDFGKGQIVLLTESYPLSNEGLRADRDAALIAKLAGAQSHIVFDESHLGVSNTGSIGTLIRRYRLTGAFAVTLLLGALFLWKNSTSLLPHPADSNVIGAIGADSQSGLINLLKRSVPSAQLAKACWDRWKDTRSLGRPISQERVLRAERIIAAPAADSPAAIYRSIQKILTEKT